MTLQDPQTLEFLGGLGGYRTNDRRGLDLAAVGKQLEQNPELRVPDLATNRLRNRLRGGEALARVTGGYRALLIVTLQQRVAQRRQRRPVRLIKETLTGIRCR